MGRGGSFLVTPVIVASLVSLLASASGARAASITLSGYVADPLNAALIGSDAWAGAVPPSPLFGDDFEIDDNVALHEIVLVTGGMTTFESLGFGLGGIDPYFSLFAGGGAGATFVGSNWDDAFFGDGGDFLLQFNLAPGIYSVAIGTFANMSFAENIGAGVLGDGFIAAGSGFLGSLLLRARRDAFRCRRCPSPRLWPYSLQLSLVRWLAGDDNQTAAVAERHLPKENNRENDSRTHRRRPLPRCARRHPAFVCGNRCGPD